MSGRKKEQWLAAIYLKDKSLESIGLWKLFDRPQPRKVIPGQKVHALKRNGTQFQNGAVQIQ